MKLTLYHYVHCPYCLRVRMALGYLGLAYRSILVPYDDEATPLKLTGTKMLPIMEIDGKAMNESLDIIHLLDKEDLLRVKSVTSSINFGTFNNLLTQLGTNVHNLAMPYWMWTPEFNEKSRQYFQEKKEIKRGAFKNLVKSQDQYVSMIQNDLEKLINDLNPFYLSEAFSLYDILLASHLWGLYIVPEFQFSGPVHNYLQNVKKICHFDYHEDFWNT